MIYKNKKSIILTGGGAAAGLLAAAVVLANSATTTLPRAENGSGGNMGGAGALDSNNAGAQSVDSRLQVMQKLRDRVKDMNIDESKKIAIEKRVQTAIDLLSKAKEASDGEAKPGQKNTVKDQVIAGRRETAGLNFGMTIPQGFLLGAIQRIETISQNLEKISVKFGSVIDKRNADGIDTPDVKNGLKEMDDLIVQARENAKNANDIVANLDPDAAGISKTDMLQQMKQARQFVAEATRDLKQARQVAASVLKSLKRGNIDIQESANN